MVYAIYDTTGIQSYIFASTKLKENIGASELVGQVFTKFLPQVLKHIFGEDNIITDWKNQPTTDNWTLTKTAEIIYVGGGNAYVAYSSACAYKEATTALLRKVYDKTATIGIASAYVETDFKSGYPQQHKDLMQKLSQAKGEATRPIGAGSQPITKTSLLTGLPVTEIVENEFLSKDQSLKRAANLGVFETFDDLKRGRTSFLAVIHVDGNNVGQHIETYMSNKNDDWSLAVPKIRKMSSRISEIYCKAYEATRKIFCDFYTSDKCKNYRKEVGDKDKLPLLKLISDGDDITCVITGLWGISFATELLRQIEYFGNIKLNPFEKWPEGLTKPRISACAGVVLFHSHYPFSEAYKMAEECCRNAKKYTRKAEEYTNNVVGSFIDFHLHQGGAITDLQTLRNRKYRAGDKNLIHVPYWVENKNVMDAENLARFESKYPSIYDFDTLIRDWTNQDSKSKWPRSRLKALQGAIAEGEGSVQKVIDWCKVRGYLLPEKYETYLPPDDDNDDNRDKLYKYTRLFNVLEFADIYENICEGSE